MAAATSQITLKQQATGVSKAASVQCLGRARTLPGSQGRTFAGSPARHYGAALLGRKWLSQTFPGPSERRALRVWAPK